MTATVVDVKTEAEEEEDVMLIEFLGVALLQTQ